MSSLRLLLKLSQTVFRSLRNSCSVTSLRRISLYCRCKLAIKGFRFSSLCTNCSNSLQKKSELHSRISNSDHAMLGCYKAFENYRTFINRSSQKTSQSPGFREKRVFCHKFTHNIEIFIDLLTKIYQGVDAESSSETVQNSNIKYEASQPASKPFTKFLTCFERSIQRLIQVIQVKLE